MQYYDVVVGFEVCCWVEWVGVGVVECVGVVVHCADDFGVEVVVHVDDDWVLVGCFVRVRGVVVYCFVGAVVDL